MKLLKLISTLIIIVLLASCVQDTQPKTITVKVDMTGIENPSKVGLRGNGPLSWEETTYLRDINDDGIYEETFEIYSANQDIEFKFVNNENEFELKDQSNRSLSFEYKPEIIIYEATFDNLKDIKITRN